MSRESARPVSVLVAAAAAHEVGVAGHPHQLDAGAPGQGVFAVAPDDLHRALARRLHPGQRNSLDALCKRYAVDNAGREFHGALLDQLTSWGLSPAEPRLDMLHLNIALTSENAP